MYWGGTSLPYGDVVMKQVAEETATLFDVGIDGCRETVRVDMVAGWLIILPISWIVDHESIVGRGVPNNNAPWYALGVLIIVGR